MIFLDNNELVERGCTLDRKKNPSAEYKFLEICKESGCNRRNMLYSNCVFCDSQKDDKCFELPDPEIFTKQCKGTYTHEKRGCYTFRQSMQSNKIAIMFQLMLLMPDLKNYLFEI